MRQARERCLLTVQAPVQGLAHLKVWGRIMTSDSDHRPIEWFQGKVLFAHWLTFLFAISAGIGSARGTVLTPTGVLATSEFGAVEFLGLSDVFAEDLIDGGGLMDADETPDNILDDLHDNDAFWTNGWHSGDFSAGLPGGLDNDGDPFTAPPVDEQIIEFQLGGLAAVSRAHIWQQNQSGLATNLAPLRGVDEFEILVSTDISGDVFVSAGQFRLEPEEGSMPVPAQVIQLANPVVARRIRFDINSAQSGELNEFVGLAEVRFEGEMVAELKGDFDGDGDLSAADIDRLSSVVRSGENTLAFDLNDDQIVNMADRATWVEELKRTYFGDSNLDREFNSSDLVLVFQSGQYEDATPQNSGWATGDWNGDGEFDSTDFVTAFQAGGYEKGPRGAIGVPEPSEGLLVALAIVMICLGKRSQASVNRVVW
jgi:hypothetical protein